MRNRVSLFILLIFSMMFVLPISAQEGSQFPPITPENADQLVQIAVFGCGENDYNHPSERTRSLLLFSPDSQELGFLGGTGSFCFWNVSAGDEIRHEFSTQLFPYAFAFTEQGHLVFSIPSFDYFQIFVSNLDTNDDWRTSTCKENNSLLSADHELLAIGGLNCDTELWRWQQDEKISALELDQSLCDAGHANACYSSGIAFSVSGDRLVTSWRRYTFPIFSIIALWDTETGANLATIEDAADAAFSPDGTQLVVSGSSGTRLLNPDTGEETLLVDGQFERLAFSPDGHWIAARDRNGVVHLLDARSLTELVTLANPVASHSPLVFNSNSQVLATIAADTYALQLWEVTTGDMLVSLDFPVIRAINVTFSPDGNFLAAAFDDRSILVWGIP